MTVQINGSGSISGINVGGLPDGIVDSDMIANATIATADLATGVGGKLLNVVTASSSTTNQTPSANDTWTDVAPTATITPSSTSSRIIIVSSTTMIVTNTQYVAFQLLRGSTSIREWHGYNDSSNWQTLQSPPMHIDSPNTTSAITYKFQIRCDQNYDDIKWNYNGQSANNRTSELYLAEIGP